jgi:hypothetical protein
MCRRDQDCQGAAQHTATQRRAPTLVFPTKYPEILVFLRIVSTLEAVDGGFDVKSYPIPPYRSTKSANLSRSAKPSRRIRIVSSIPVYLSCSSTSASFHEFAAASRFGLIHRTK